MRRAYDSTFLIHNDVLLGINLGADFTSKQEWGIKSIKQQFGIPQEKTDFGIKRRAITVVPPPNDFGWTTGAMPKSEGFYLFSTWRNEKPHFSDNRELKTFRSTLACAWDERSLGVFSSDAEEISSLKDIYESFHKGDGAVFLGGGGVFKNSGLCLVIASRIPQEFLDGWYNADKEAYELDQEVEATGIRQLLAEKGKHYFALSRPRHREEDGKLILWLNPMEQKENNFGWFTIDDLREWADNKGKIPVATGGKR